MFCRKVEVKPTGATRIRNGLLWPVVEEEVSSAKGDLVYWRRVKRRSFRYENGAMRRKWLPNWTPLTLNEEQRSLEDARVVHAAREHCDLAIAKVKDEIASGKLKKWTPTQLKKNTVRGEEFRVHRRIVQQEIHGRYRRPF